MGVGSVVVELAFLGRPDFQSRGPKIVVLKGLGTSGRKIGAPQKRQIQPRRIQPPILGPLTFGRFDMDNIEMLELQSKRPTCHDKMRMGEGRQGSGSFQGRPEACARLHAKLGEL